ncbi:MAG: FGGY family carbohydrate kinase [candidate division WOR-3 bacterium]|nr:FGGY family carbohydrate kinase [candidate division WOR-3 bacterium]
MSVIGLDLGTTVCKASLFDEEGNLLSLERKEYPMYSPHPGWVEQDKYSSIQEAAKQMVKINIRFLPRYIQP